MHMGRNNAVCAIVPSTSANVGSIYTHLDALTTMGILHRDRESYITNRVTCTRRTRGPRLLACFSRQAVQWRAGVTNVLYFRPAAHGANAFCSEMLARSTSES